RDGIWRFAPPRPTIPARPARSAKVDKNWSRDTIYRTDERLTRRACGRGARGLGGDGPQANRGVVFAVHRGAQPRARLLRDGGRGLPVAGVRAMLHGIAELVRRRP